MRPPSSRSLRALERTLRVLAVVPVLTGAATALLGSASVPAPGDPSANLGSELRFYAIWWIGAGVFLLWLAPRVGHRTRELRAFCALLALAGAARAIGIAADGRPSDGQVALMVVELVLPVVLVLWQRHAVSRAPSTAPARGA